MKATRGRRAPGVVRGMRVGVLVVVSVVAGTLVAINLIGWLGSFAGWSARTTSLPWTQRSRGKDQWTIAKTHGALFDQYVLSFDGSGDVGDIAGARSLFSESNYPDELWIPYQLAPGQTVIARFRGWPFRYGFTAAPQLWSGSISSVPKVQSWSASGIIWPGLLADVAIFSLPVFLAAAGVLNVLGLRRRVRRAESGQCMDCGYELRGATGAVCPECGAANPMHRARGEVVDQKGSDAGEVRV